MKDLKKTALAAAGAAAFCTGAYAALRSFIPAPRALGDEKYAVRTEKLPVFTGGRRIYGELMTPLGRPGRLPTVIACHGYGSSYRFVKSSVGESLAMSGYAVYVFDFCGGSPISRSSGRFADMTVFTEKSDLLAVIDFVKALPCVDTSRLYLLGESQGGLVSAITAVGRQEDIRALCLYYPAFSIPSDARGRYPSKDAIPPSDKVFGLKIGAEYSRAVYDFDVFDCIKSLALPVLVLHGDRDKVVDVSYGRMGAEAMPNARFVLMPGEIHGWTGRGKVSAARLAYGFFEENA